MFKNGRKSHLWNKKSFLKFSAAALCCSVSIHAIDNVYHFEPDTFSKSEVIINNDTIPISEFYECLHYNTEEKRWIYTNAEGKDFDLDSLSDYRIKDEQRSKCLASQKYTLSRDTVIIHYPNEGKPGSIPYFELAPNDSLKNMPARGKQIWGKVSIREFVVDPSLPPERKTTLQKRWDIHNDSLNCTEAHEKQHRKNELLGLLKAGQSYDNVYITAIVDEIVANIAQLLAQRENYLKRGRDISSITPRFAFYADAIRNGDIKPYPKIYTKTEINLIGNGVFDSWMAESFEAYKAPTVERAKYILSHTNVNGIKEDSLKHQQLIKDMFQIDGINFHEVLKTKVNDLKVPEETQKLFRDIVKKRIQNIDRKSVV